MATTAPLIPVVDQATILNQLSEQFLGSSVVVETDLSNIADFGRAYGSLDSTTKQIVTGSLVTLVTKQIVDVKAYGGNGIDVVRSRSNEGYDTSAGIIEMIRPVLPKAISDAEVYDPAPGSSSDPFVNHPIALETLYYNKPISFRYEWSRPERWLTGAFVNAGTFGKVISAIDQTVRNAIQLNVDTVTFALVRASIALNLIGGASPRSINLLAEYNTSTGSATPLTVANCLKSPEFLRFAIHRIFVVSDYLKSYNSLYNEMSYPNFSSEETLNFILHSQFLRSAEQFLQADVFHDEFVRLPKSETVTSWKGLITTAGTAPDFAATSLVNDSFDFTVLGKGKKSVKQSGVVAHLFDDARIGIHDLSVFPTSQFDPVGLKTNIFEHGYGKSAVDPYSQAVTFYVADA